MTHNDPYGHLSCAPKNGQICLTHTVTHTKKSRRGYTGFDRQVFLDFEAKNGRKSLAPQGFDGSTAAHNPEVAGSSPVSATIKVLKSQDFRTFSLFFIEKYEALTSGFCA